LRIAVVHRKAWPGIRLIVVGFMAVMVFMFSFSVDFTTGRAQTLSAASLCGNGSAPDYGLTYDFQQPHWTVGWEGYTSERTVAEVDTILDHLNEDAIAQTMILIQPQEQVGIRTNCAVHFLRYMQLGLPTGERKDNGFVFLIVVEPESIDVHYAVGLGLPALTAPELTNINRAAEAAYQSTHSIDEALLTLAQEFDTVARDNYSPLLYPTPIPENTNIPSGPVSILAICGQLCMGLFVLFFIMWMLTQGGMGGGGFNSSGSSSWGRGGFSSGRGGFSSGRGSSGPRMRGGSGSGRSGRTN
jgi:hypothetical protein